MPSSTPPDFSPKDASIPKAPCNSPCVIPCEQALRRGTAFPSLSSDAAGINPVTAMPCQPRENTPEALLTAIVSTDFMRHDLSLYLALHPTDEAMLALYRLLSQKLDALHASMDEQSGHWQGDYYPLYPLENVKSDVALCERVLTVRDHRIGPFALAMLDFALSTRLSPPLSLLYSQLGTECLAIARMLGDLAIGLDAHADIQDAAWPALPAWEADIPTLMTEALSRARVIAGMADVLILSTQDSAVEEALRFIKTRMFVHARRMEEAMAQSQA